jgi:hypothetical protein
VVHPLLLALASVPPERHDPGAGGDAVPPTTPVTVAYLFCVNLPSSATVRPCRPLRRRRARTALPPRSAMRCRKPNLRIRLIRFG